MKEVKSFTGMESLEIVSFSYYQQHLTNEALKLSSALT